MSNISFSLCDKEKKPELLNFIKNHWSKDHIFLNSDKLLNWQHLNKEEKYNFWLAYDDKLNRILGILGFIPTSQFSEQLESQKTFWLAIWKIDENHAPPGLGMMLLKTLIQFLNVDILVGSGISELSKKFYNMLRYETGSLSQHFLINPDKEDFKILTKPRDLNFQIIDKSESVLLELNKNNIYEKCKNNEHNIFVNAPKKNTEYMFNRYLDHPIYEYKVFGLMQDNKVNSILVLREVSVDNSHAVRLIDFQGENKKLKLVVPNLVNMLIAENYEYLDFIQTGISETFLNEIGFLNLSDYADVIVPNYFEPFTNRNITIDFCYKNFINDKKVYIFKGDSDQDRPNLTV